MDSQSFFSVFFVVIALSLISSVYCDYDEDLDYSYYEKSCGDFEEIVAKKLMAAYEKDKTIAASLIRLHFHDCAIRGCDASVLLDYPGSEKRANASKTLRGFEVIDEIKKAVEKKCPKTVSCADILTAAARDATLLVKGPYWSNKYGRRDGLISYAHEAEYLPNGHEDVTSLIEFFQSKGLNMFDLVVLSGAHTIGKCTCGSIADRLYNFRGTGKPDPTLSPSYLNYLRRKCNNPRVYVDLDAGTPFTFDNNYYKNLVKNMGLLYSDQVLYRDHRTFEYIDSFALESESYPYLFASSMVKLGNILGDAEDDGEVRLTCSRVNSY